MRTPADIMAVALTNIEQTAQNHILKPNDKTVPKIVTIARDALMQASSVTTIVAMKVALKQARKAYKRGKK